MALTPRRVGRPNAVIGFGAVEFGYQTLDKLADHVMARLAARKS